MSNLILVRYISVIKTEKNEDDKDEEIVNLVMWLMFKMKTGVLFSEPLQKTIEIMPFWYLFCLGDEDRRPSSSLGQPCYPNRG